MNFPQLGRGQVELEQVIAPSDGQHTRMACREMEGLAVDQDVAGGERGVAAQLDFARRREPAQVIVRVFAARSGR